MSPAELGFYYLNSRYYDPVTSRFISPDDISVITATPNALTDKNLYAYCDNNPVTRVDHGGEFWLTTLGIMSAGGFIGGAISGVSSIVTQALFNDEVNWKSVGVAAASGFASGFIAASPLGTKYQVIFGGIIGGLSYVADAYITDSEIDLIGVVLAIGGGALSGYIGKDGADYGKFLTNTIDNTKRTIAREGRRANEKFAKKAISNAIRYRNNTISTTAWESSARFAVGTGISNLFNTGYSKIQILIHLLRCKFGN